MIPTYSWDVSYARQDGSGGALVVHGQLDALSASCFACSAIDKAGEDLSTVAIIYMRRRPADRPVDAGRHPVASDLASLLRGPADAAEPK
jgi:hypothetical protein